MSLLNKYGIKAPRYTSYPAHPYWNNKLDTSDIFEFLTDETKKESIDLYIHVPFCTSPCLYCGCNKVIANSGKFDDVLLAAIKKEWDFYTSKIN